MIDNFRFHCQKVLPLSYDDSLSYYEVVCKVATKLNEVIDSQNLVTEGFGELQGEVGRLLLEFNDLEDGVATFKTEVLQAFEDFKGEVDEKVSAVAEAIVTQKIDEMLASPEFNQMIQDKVNATVGASVSNENLLDNSWFTVNQRGQTSYTVANGYTVDRWKHHNSAYEVEVTSGGIKCIGGGGVCQYFENPERFYGKTLTLSAIIDGVLYSNSGIISEPSGLSTPINITLPNGVLRVITDVNEFQVNLFCTTGYDLTCKCIKLELGTVSTLANDVAPDYGTELSKCQRYFYRPTETTYPTLALQCTASRQFEGCINFPVSMRTTPAIKINGIRVTATGAVSIQNPTLISYQRTTDGIGYLYFVSTSEFTNIPIGSYCGIDFEASADL